MTPAQEVLFRQGRTVTWVARQLGIERTYLSRMLAGQRPMPPPVRERLAGLLGVPAAYLDTSTMQPVGAI